MEGARELRGGGDPEHGDDAAREGHGPAGEDPTVSLRIPDKNVAKRREDPNIPAKGHMDPDLGTGQLLTEAPTATKMAFTALLALSSV